MHVPDSPVPRFARPPFAAAVVAMFASVIGVARAAEFDEKVKAPQAKSAEHLRSVARAASQEFADASLDGREAVIRDPSKARRQFDARWAMVHAVETRAPLGDLAEFGITPNEKGEVKVDLGRFPQWDEFDGRVVRMLRQLQLDALGEQLINRGMTEQDVAALQAYVARNDPDALRRQAQLPVTLGFLKVVRKYDKIKRPVPRDSVFDYFYQSEAVSADVNRAWMVGLLEALEPHAARILMSYFGELQSTALWGPSDMDAVVRDRLAAFRMPDFEQRARAEAAGGAK